MAVGRYRVILVIQGVIGGFAGRCRRGGAGAGDRSGRRGCGFGGRFGSRVALGEGGFHVADGIEVFGVGGDGDLVRRDFARPVNDGGPAGEKDFVEVAAGQVKGGLGAGGGVVAVENFHMPAGEHFVRGLVILLVVRVNQDLGWPAGFLAFEIHGGLHVAFGQQVARVHHHRDFFAGDVAAFLVELGAAGEHHALRTSAGADAHDGAAAGGRAALVIHVDAASGGHEFVDVVKLLHVGADGEGIGGDGGDVGVDRAFGLKNLVFQADAQDIAGDDVLAQAGLDAFGCGAVVEARQLGGAGGVRAEIGCLAVNFEVLVADDHVALEFELFGGEVVALLAGLNADLVFHRAGVSGQGGGLGQAQDGQSQGHGEGHGGQPGLGHRGDSLQRGWTLSGRARFHLIPEVAGIQGATLKS